MTSDALQQFKLELPISLAGTAPLEAEVEEDQDGLQRVRLSVNLEPVDLSAPSVNWQKPAGKAGKLEAEWQVADSGIVVDRFDLIGGDPDLRANARLKTEPLRLDSLDITQLRLGATDTKMTLHAQAGDSFEVMVDAKQLDLDRLLAENSESKDGAGKPPRLLTPLKIRTQVDQLKWQDAWFKAVRGQLARSPEGWQSAVLTSELPGGGALSIDLAPGESGLDLNIRTDDAGDLSSLLLGGERVMGGELNLVASMIGQQKPDLVADGKLVVQDFTLISAPVLARLLTLASIQGIGDLLGSEGISFDHLEVPFKLSNGILSLEKARMAGSQIGLSCSGQMNLEQDHLDLDGTIIPAYTLNRTIGQIPLIGDILAGSRSEGAFSVTYAIRGSRTKPELTVNPLSVLAPGILQDLFSGITNRTSDAPTTGD